MRKRPLKMDRWGISFNAYMELYHFCQQYAEKKRAADALIGPGSSMPEAVTVRRNERGETIEAAFLPRGRVAPGDTVSRTVEKRERLLGDVRLIEEAARLADPQLAPYILQAVTTRRDIRSIAAPCGYHQFLDARRRFFRILWEMRR